MIAVTVQQELFMINRKAPKVKQSLAFGNSPYASPKYELWAAAAVARRWGGQGEGLKEESGERDLVRTIRGGFLEDFHGVHHRSWFEFL